jgi:hypothetical protein
LESLFVVAERRALGELGDCFSLAKRLRVIHINFPHENLDEAPILPIDEGLEIAKKCPPTIRQFGCNTRVWQVHRTVERDENGELRVERILGPYERPEIPEAFLVVRA